MKAIKLLMLASLSASTAAANESSDTIAVVEDPVSVAVTSNANGMKITVYGSVNDPNNKLVYESTVNEGSETDEEQLWVFNPFFAKLSANKKKRSRVSSDVFGDIYAGAVIPIEGDPGISRTGWEIGMLNVGKVSWRLSNFGTSLSVGIGWQYRHFTIGDNLMAYRGDNGAYMLEPIVEGYHKVKSSLKSFGIQFPVLIKIKSGFTIEVGGVAMLNTYVSGNCSWHEGDVTSKRPIKHLHQRILTVDGLVRVGWSGCLAFYVRYSPMKLFKAQYGPQFDAVAVGGSIGF